MQTNIMKKHSPSGEVISVYLTRILVQLLEIHCYSFGSVGIIMDKCFVSIDNAIHSTQRICRPLQVCRPYRSVHFSLFHFS